MDVKKDQGRSAASGQQKTLGTGSGQFSGFGQASSKKKKWYGPRRPRREIFTGTREVVDANGEVVECKFYLPPMEADLEGFKCVSDEPTGTMEKPSVKPLKFKNPHSLEHLGVMQENDWKRCKGNHSVRDTCRFCDGQTGRWRDTKNSSGESSAAFKEYSRSVAESLRSTRSTLRKTSQSNLI